RASCQANAGDRRSTARAWLARTAVNSELPLIFTLPSRAADVIANARTAALDGPVQHQDYAPPQTRRLLWGGRAARLGRVQPRLEQRFVGVDIPHTGTDALIPDHG